MNSQTQRLVAGAERVSPLTGPSYGAYSVAKRRWQKPIPAIIADGIANSRAVAARLERGMYMPDEENKAHYKAVFNTLLDRTREQLKALEAFAAIAWSDQ